MYRSHVVRDKRSLPPRSCDVHLACLECTNGTLHEIITMRPVCTPIAVHTLKRAMEVHTASKVEHSATSINVHDSAGSRCILRPIVAEARAYWITINLESHQGHRIPKEDTGNAINEANIVNTIYGQCPLNCSASNIDRHADSFAAFTMDHISKPASPHMALKLNQLYVCVSCLICRYPTPSGTIRQQNGKGDKTSAANGQQGC